ncbi:MAG: cobalamin biosynthesis protein CobD [Synergistales bacterium]|nr:cobalamin biosynthesis protein CobD [Synergistales bacterium]
MIQALSVLLVAVSIDLLIGEPPDRFHPVCWMGGFIRSMWSRRPNRWLFAYGAMLLSSGLAIFALLGMAVSHLWWPLSFTLSVWLLKGSISAQALIDAGREVQCAVASGKIDKARKKLSWHLVSRDTSSLSLSEVVGAAVESLSENLSDGWVGPLLAYSLFGLPGALAYRFVNTCDSMLGYRYGDFELGGKPSALLDDLINLIPSRVSASLLVVASYLSGLDWRGALLSSLRFHGVTESPNAGWPMAAVAGALGLTLTKRGCYSIEGGSRDPEQRDLAVSIRVVQTAQILAVLIAIIVTAGVSL